MNQLEIKTRKGTTDGLTDAERLQLGALFLKAGYGVKLTKKRQAGKSAYDYYIVLSGGFLEEGTQ